MWNFLWKKSKDIPANEDQLAHNVRSAIDALNFDHICLLG